MVVTFDAGVFSAARVFPTISGASRFRVCWGFNGRLLFDESLYEFFVPDGIGDRLDIKLNINFL